jgi:serine/threonine protein kinase/Leucine-rich repeat (LRR) protein
MSDDDRLWDILARWDDLHLAGQPVSAEELCQDCPELLTRVEDHIQALTAMSWLNQEDEDGSDSREGNQAEEARQEGSPSMTPRALIEGLSLSGLLPPTDVKELVRSHPPESSSVEEMARSLVDSKKLTAYQVSLLCEGRWKGLVLAEYTILNRIGAGGMGQVFLAVHRRMDRIVALKVLPKETTASADAIRRFHHEVKAAAKLSHANIVTAHDAGEQEGVHYLVMEYIEGTDLSRLVKEQGPLPVDKATDCILQAARGLEYAHRRGIIHRDIKPGNLLMNTEGVVKVLDMGLARMQLLSEGGGDASPSEITRTGTVMGTADYTAPEQSVDAASVDRRADVYSLGCTLYFLLTGKPVYSGGNSMQRFLAHRESPIPSLRAARPEVTEALDRVFQRMVAKKPEDRFASMVAVIEALTSCPVHQAAPAAPAVPTATEEPKWAAAATQALAKPQPAPGCPQPSAPTRSRKKRWLPAAVAVAVVGILGTLYVAGVVFKVKTPGGTVWVEVDEPGAEVLVDGKQITITRPGDEAVKIELEEGKHELTVTKGGFKTSTKQFTLKAGGKATIRVRLVRAEVEPVKVGVKPLEASSFQRWLKQVAGMPAGKQVEAVAAKLKELNPAFDGKVAPTIEGEQATGLAFLTDNVKDLSPVRALKGLKSLSINGSGPGKGKLSDLSPLQDMKLTHLYCYNTQVSDLSPLKDMKLTSLDCTHTQVSDLSPLKGMNALAYLACHHTRVADLSPVRDMKLEILGCSRTKVSDLTPLKGMKLTVLNCGDTNVSNLTPLKDMKLTHLYCYNTRVSDLTPLKDMKLAHLYCSATKVTDLSPLKGMPLRHLRFQYTKVTDLSPLKGMPLALLACAGTPVSDLSPLKSMKLTVLYCQHTKVSDLSPLKGMPLTQLNCRDTQVSDLSPLQGMKLTSLNFGSTNVTDLSPLKGAPLEELWCDFKPERDTEILRSIKTLKKINEKPVKAFWEEVDAKKPKTNP